MPRLPAFLISLGLFLTLTTTAFADGHGIYMGGIIGGTYRPDTSLSSLTLVSGKIEFDAGFTIGGVVGYDFGNHFRLEGEISYHENEIRTGSGKNPQAATSSIMLNVFYDFLPFQKYFDVYIGGGIGAATAQLQTISLGQVLNTDETVFAFQLETGIDWHFNPKTTFSLGYRFFRSDDPEFKLPSGDRAEIELESHEILLKMRYRFNL